MLIKGTNETLMADAIAMPVIKAIATSSKGALPNSFFSDIKIEVRG
jgi:hypothetical protein